MRAMFSLFSLAKRFKDFRVPRALLGQFQPAGAHDRGQVAPRFFELFVYYNIIKLVAMRDLVARVPQPALDGLLAVLAPPPQAMLELAEDRRRRKDEDAHRVGKGLADLPGALPVDLQHDVEALGARFLDPSSRSAVAVAVHLRRFEKVAALEHRVEGLAVDEMVFTAVQLARAGSPSGVRHRQREPLVVGERGFHQRGLARSRRRGHDEQAPFHSMFCICSRICSISSLNSRLASEISFDTDLDPRVLASRFSSCIRKSRRLPTAPPAVTTRDTSSRCAARRVSSSATSAFTPNSAISWRTRSSSVPPSASRRRAESVSW